jgi:hypothetical protein
LIPIDNIKYWSKIEFCQVILEEFTELAEDQKTKLNHSIKLEFCTIMDRNFGEAVKACGVKIKEAKCKTGIESKTIILNI